MPKPNCAETLHLPTMPRLVHDNPEKAGQASVFPVAESAVFRYFTKHFVKRPDDRRFGFPVQHIDGSQVASFIDLRGLGLRESFGQDSS